LVKNSQKLTTTYIMRRLHDSDLYYFSTPAFAALLDMPTTKAYTVLRRLKREGVIRPVEAGKYVLLGYQPERVLANPHFVATRLAHPAYISFWSALHFHGLTEQVPRTIFVATTRRHQRLNLEGATFAFVHVAPHKFFGYQREMIGDLPVLMADIEKALVDSLSQPRYAGGFAEVAKAFYGARARVDGERLVEYANRMRNRSLCSRLGYLLGQFERPVQGLNVSQSFVLLDPQSKAQGAYDARWRVRVNVTDKELWTWRES
jgi:predicted transcriptional regulator of viral defense system